MFQRRQVRQQLLRRGARRRRRLALLLRGEGGEGCQQAAVQQAVGAGRQGGVVRLAAALRLGDAAVAVPLGAGAGVRVKRKEVA